MELPVTTVETARNMTAGLQLLKIIELKDWLNKDGSLRRDSNGWPGLEIVMQNQAGEKISFTNYYCDKPINDFVRTDPNRRCKSEFYLARFKAALGFTTGAVSEKDLIGKKLFVPLKEVHYTLGDGKTPALNDSGNPMIFNELVKEFFPYTIDPETKKASRPEVPGDPLLNNGIATGIFIEYKISTKVASAVPPAIQSMPEQHVVDITFADRNEF